MSDPDFWEQVSGTFPCLINGANATVVCRRLYSSCEKRRAGEGAAEEFCPILKFAAHTFSASLVQGRVREVREDIRRVQTDIERINARYFSPNAPDYVRGMATGPEIKDEKNNLARFIGRLKSTFGVQHAEGFFHLLRINVEARRSWGCDQRWESLEARGREVLRALEQPAPEGQASLSGLPVALAAIVLEGILNRMTPTEASAEATRHGRFAAFFSDAVRSFYDVAIGLDRIERGTRSEHERAYARQLSDPAFPSDVPSFFNGMTRGLAKYSGIWGSAWTGGTGAA